MKGRERRTQQREKERSLMTAKEVGSVFFRAVGHALHRDTPLTDAQCSCWAKVH